MKKSTVHSPESKAGDSTQRRRGAEPAETTSDSGFLFDSLVARVIEFQTRTFPNQSVDAKLAHLLREINEVRQSPKDLSEWADCLILLLGAVSAQGICTDDLFAAAHLKMDINNARKWNPPDAEGVCSHIEEKGARK